MAAPNLLSLTTITGMVASANCTTASANVVYNAASSGKVLKVNSIYVSNIDGSSSADATVKYVKADTNAASGQSEYAIASTIAVAADATLDLLSNPLYLEEASGINCLANANDDLQIVIGYEELS